MSLLRGAGAQAGLSLGGQGVGLVVGAVVRQLHRRATALAGVPHQVRARAGCQKDRIPWSVMSPPRRSEWALYVTLSLQ
jgi:hypothetical protein